MTISAKNDRLKLHRETSNFLRLYKNNVHKNVHPNIQSENVNTQDSLLIKPWFNSFMCEKRIILWKLVSAKEQQ